MTNEELCISAKSGDMEAVEALYINNQRLMFKLCNSLANNRSSVEDLMQEGYFALIKAIAAFDSSRGYKFTSYLTRALEWHFIRMRKQDKNKDDMCILDSPAAVGVDITKGELIEDDRIDVEDTAITNCWNAQLREALEETMRAVELSPFQIDLLRGRYYHNQTLNALGAYFGMTTNEIHSEHQKALKKLRKPSKNRQKLRDFVDDIISKSYLMSSYTFFKATNTSSVEWAVLEMEKKKERFSAP